MTSRERFEAWLKGPHINNFNDTNHPLTPMERIAASLAWQAAERQALERAARYFEDRTYDSDVAKAIRALNESKKD